VPQSPKPERENATFVMLTTNWEMNGALRVVGQLEERFNRKHKYPWIFLNDQPFSEEFEQCVELRLSFTVP
jgi:alpha 1,2-mannosyltransferase